MPFTPSPAEIAALQRSADRVARRIIRQCQPSRGDLGAFAASCFEHRAIRLVERIKRSRATMSPVSLDDPQPGSEGLAIGDSIAEADGYGAWLGQVTDAFAAAERRLDLDRALGTLPADFLSLCAELVERSPHELAKASPTSRATLYRQLHELRLRLLVAGVPAGA